MSFKPIDGAKEDFRKYLDRKGVMDALTKAFVLCYDERPENPIERLVEVVADNAKILGASSELKSRLINTELELKQARAEIEVLRKQLSDLGVSPAMDTTKVVTSTATGNGPAIATLSAEAEKTVPSSNTSAVEAAAVATGAIPKTPKATQGSPVKKETPESNTESSNETPVAVADSTLSPPSTNDAKTQEETTAAATTTTTTATNTEDSASSGTKEAAT